MNDRCRMQRLSTRIIASTVMLAQGILLLAGCAEEPPQMTVPPAPSIPAGPMMAAGVAGKPGTVVAPMAPGGASGAGPNTPAVAGPNPTPGAPPGSMMQGPGTVPAAMAGAPQGGAGAPADPGGTPAGASCIEPVTDFTTEGPFTFMKEMSGMVHLWIPMVPAGCKVPMVHYANGTNSTCDPNFEIMERLATHGFLGLCYENPNTGAGTQAIMAYDTAMMMHGDMIDAKIGSMGHSQGGQAAFIAMQLAEEKYGLDKTKFAGLAVEPASGFGTQPMGGSWQSVYAKIKSPMFMFSGTMDNLVSEGWVRQAYDAMPAENEVYWYSAVGATHVPAPNRWQVAVSVPWFRWKLLGEKAACEAFKALPDGELFDPRESMNEAPCE
jgi:hypothetical protein